MRFSDSSSVSPKGETYHHLHSDFTIDSIHEDIELIQTTNWTADCLPKGKQETDCRERFLSSRKRSWIFSTLLVVLSRVWILGLNLDGSQGRNKEKGRTTSVWKPEKRRKRGLDPGKRHRRLTFNLSVCLS